MLYRLLPLRLHYGALRGCWHEMLQQRCRMSYYCFGEQQWYVKGGAVFDLTRVIVLNTSDTDSGLADAIRSIKLWY